MATTDLITGVSSANARPQPTTVTASRAGGVTTLSVDALTGWETSTAVHFQTYQLNSSTNEKVAGSEQDWKGDVSGTTLINISKTSDGADTGNSIGDVVVAMPTAGWADQLAQGLLVTLEPTGVLKAGIVSTAALADTSVTNAKLATGSTGPGGAWQTWVPTHTGFSVAPASGIYIYKQVGKIVTMTIREPFNGTSNSTSFAISLPVTAATRTNVRWSAFGVGVDNTTDLSEPVPALITSGGTTVVLNKQLGSAAWTASGSKALRDLTMTYEAA